MLLGATDLPLRSRPTLLISSAAISLVVYRVELSLGATTRSRRTATELIVSPRVWLFCKVELAGVERVDRMR